MEVAKNQQLSCDKVELINGELIISPTPSPEHQRIAGKLFRIIDKATQGTGEVFFAPIDLYVDEKNVFQPDLVYLSDQNKKHLTSRKFDSI